MVKLPSFLSPPQSLPVGVRAETRSDSERVEAFLRELTDLTHRHGLVICVDGIDLKDRPVVAFTNYEDCGLRYKTDEADRLMFVAD